MAEIRKQFRYDAETGQLQSLANSGCLALASLGRQAWQTCGPSATAAKDKRGADPDFLGEESALTIQYGDVADLMAKPEFYGAMFQVASQANFLEFIDRPFRLPTASKTTARTARAGPCKLYRGRPGTIVRNYLWDLEHRRRSGTAWSTR